MKLSFVVLFIGFFLAANAQSKIERSLDFPIVNSESTSLLIHKPKAFQLIIDKVSGTVNGKVSFEKARKDEKGNLIGWTVIQQFNLVDIWQQIVICNVDFQRVSIQTKGTMLLKCKYIFKQ